MEHVPSIGTGILKLNYACPNYDTKFELLICTRVPLRVMAAGLVTPVNDRDLFSSIKYKPSEVLLVIFSLGVPPVEREYLTSVKLILIELPAALFEVTTF